MRPTLGAYTIIKNEAHWVGYCVMAAKDIVDQFVYFDGDSTDGTVELLAYLKKKYKLNIQVHKHKDPKDLKDAYVDMFNECIAELKTDYAWFLHPDMLVTKADIKIGNALAYSTKMASFAGNPGGDILRFQGGRAEAWKNIMRNDFGLHYYGHYGVYNEDMYFEEITGETHDFHSDFSKYPYTVMDSGIELNHYSDVRPYQRRFERMVSCINNDCPNASQETVKKIATIHPRVSLEPCMQYPDFMFSPESEHPAIFSRHCEEFANVLGKKPEEMSYIRMEAKCT